ncbi:MAG TPA: metal ABC transporter ATP-binding protein [Rhizobiales bacterium]|nr:metal ABC transporter ATP-binding protein [Hyphomicrobiales bacterium]
MESDSSRALIRASSLGISFGNRTVLSNVNLEVYPGEIITLIGPNGSGKSTLVKILLGILQADQGSIWRRKNLRIGYLPQNFPLSERIPLSVARLVNLNGHARRSDIRRALAETGIEHLIDAQATGLSGGEFQRAMLARAILRRPELLVLDEPVQGVDFAGEARLYSLIHDIKSRYGCGVLMVSHDLHLVMGGSDKVICLNRHVCCAGVPVEVARHPEYARLFGPEARNFAVYTHHHDHVHDDAGHIHPVQSGSDEGQDG